MEEGKEDGQTVVKSDVYPGVTDWCDINTAMAVSLSVENAENGSLHILNTYAHGNYVVFARTY